MEADELDVAVCGRGAEPWGWLSGAEQEQLGGFRAGLPGAGEELLDAAQAGEV